MMADWQAGEWLWFVVAIFFVCLSPIFIPFAIRARETRKDIGLALSFSVACWAWVGAITYYLVTYSTS